MQRSLLKRIMSAEDAVASAEAGYVAGLPMEVVREIMRLISQNLQGGDMRRQLAVWHTQGERKDSPRYHELEAQSIAHSRQLITDELGAQVAEEFLGAVGPQEQDSHT